MILGLNKLLACSLDETIDIGDTLVDAHNLLDRLEGESGRHSNMRDMDTLMADAMTEAEGRIARSVNGVTGVPTGLTDLDRMTSGLQNGELVVIAAASRAWGRRDLHCIWHETRQWRGMP